MQRSRHCFPRPRKSSTSTHEIVAPGYVLYFFYQSKTFFHIFHSLRSLFVANDKCIAFERLDPKIEDDRDMGHKPFYAIHLPAVHRGVCTSWARREELTNGWTCNVRKGFRIREEAEYFADHGSLVGYGSHGLASPPAAGPSRIHIHDDPASEVKTAIDETSQRP